MDNKDIIQQRVWTTKQVIIVVITVASITFSASGIWFRFIGVENEIQTNEKRATKRDVRSTEDRKAIWNEINSLKKEHK